MNIVQFGCNDAVDEVYEYVKLNKEVIDYIFLLDANIFALRKAVNRYTEILDTSKILVHFIALVCNEHQKTATFYIPNKDKNSGHSSLFKELVALNWGDDLMEQTVPCLSPNKILDKIPFKIDQLHIDVEGLDADIIMYLDLQKYDIPYIVFESAHCDGYFSQGEKYRQCVKKLTDLGYKLSQHPNRLDTIAIK